MLFVSLSVGAADIQNTFFGFKIGKRVDSNSMKDNITDMGAKLANIETEGSCWVLKAYRLPFAGYECDL